MNLEMLTREIRPLVPKPGYKVVITTDVFAEGRDGVDLSKNVFNPMARSLYDLVSAKQIQIARVLATAKDLCANGVAEELFDCELNELSKSAAQILIDHLENAVQAKESRLKMAG